MCKKNVIYVQDKLLTVKIAVPWIRAQINAYRITDEYTCQNTGNKIKLPGSI
jgi:hypothetical protein